MPTMCAEQPTRISRGPAFGCRRSLEQTGRYLYASGLSSKPMSAYDVWCIEKRAMRKLRDALAGHWQACSGEQS